MIYMEIPIKMDDLGVPPFSETPIQTREGFQIVSKVWSFRKFLFGAEKLVNNAAKVCSLQYTHDGSMGRTVYLPTYTIKIKPFIC